MRWRQLDADERTDAVVVIGEIGGDDGGGRGGLLAEPYPNPSSPSLPAAASPARQEDGARRRHRDGRQGHLRIETRKALEAAGVDGARYAVQESGRRFKAKTWLSTAIVRPGTAGYEFGIAYVAGRRKRLMTDANQPEVHRGLKDLCFDRSPTTLIDGRAGELRYRGYSIHDLARALVVRGNRLPVAARRAADAGSSSAPSTAR